MAKEKIKLPPVVSETENYTTYQVSKTRWVVVARYPLTSRGGQR